MSIPYVYQYQRNLMFSTGTEVQKPQAPKTNDANSPTPAPPSNTAFNLQNSPLGPQPLVNSLFGVPLTAQSNTVKPTTLVDLLNTKGPLQPTLEAANPVQAKLAALQPPPLPDQKVVTGPFAEIDKARSEQLAANRGVDILKDGAKAIEKARLAPTYGPMRTEDRLLQMPTMPYPSSASETSGMFGMLGRLHSLFSGNIKNPTDGHGGGQSSYMNLGGNGSGSGEGHKGENPSKRQQSPSRFSAMA